MAWAKESAHTHNNKMWDDFRSSGYIRAVIHKSHRFIIAINYCHYMRAQWIWNLLRNGYRIQKTAYTSTSCIKLQAQSWQILFFMITFSLNTSSFLPLYSSCSRVVFFPFFILFFNQFYRFSLTPLIRLCMMHNCIKKKNIHVLFEKKRSIACWTSEWTKMNDETNAFF